MIASEMVSSWKTVPVLVGVLAVWLSVLVLFLQHQCAMDGAPEYVPNAHQFGLVQSSHFVLPFNQLAVRKR